MTRYGIILTADGSLERVTLDATRHDLTGRTIRSDVPDTWPATTRWDAPTQAWVDDVAGVRTGLVDQLKMQRAAAEAISVTVPGIGVVQVNPTLFGAALAGAAASKAYGLPFPTLNLILLDNTVAPLDAVAVVKVATVMAAAEQAAVDAYTAKRNQLEAATTLAALHALMPQA